MKKFNFVFIDFDKTIYDTDRFKDDMWTIANEYKITRNDYEKTFRESLHTISAMQYDYSFEEHLDLLKKIGYDIKDKFLNELKLLANNNYLFPESENFVKFLKEHSERIILLTAGDTHFQMSKIIGCGVDEIFDEIMVAEIPKIEYFRKHFKGQANKTLFINDNLKENEAIKMMCPELIVICKFNSKKYSEAEMKQSNLPYFKTLSEIKNYVSQF